MDILKFHVQHNYYVQVLPIKNTPGCIVTFPNNILLNKKSVVKTYVLYSNPYVIELYTKIGDDIQTKIIEASSINIRLLVCIDIFLKTNELKMSKKLIALEQTNKTLFDILEVKQNSKEKKLETQLCFKFREMLEGNVPSSEIDSLVVQCFENGGL